MKRQAISVIVIVTVYRTVFVKHNTTHQVTLQHFLASLLLHRRYQHPARCGSHRFDIPCPQAHFQGEYQHV